MTVQSERELQISMIVHVILFEWMLLNVQYSTEDRLLLLEVIQKKNY